MASGNRTRSRSRGNQKDKHLAQQAAVAAVCGTREMRKDDEVCMPHAPSITADWRGRFRRFPHHRFNVIPESRTDIRRVEKKQQVQALQKDKQIRLHHNETFLVGPSSGLAVGLLPVSRELAPTPLPADGAQGMKQPQHCAVFDLSTESYTQGGIAAVKEGLLRSGNGNLRPILACAVRGADILKWILLEGEADLAHSVVVHDIPLMRNLLEGIPPAQQQEQAAQREPRSCACLTRSAKDNSRS